ncbi:Os06g0616400 [Oryza sativa Japonica Group]|jgi:hypothetical protein|uniref:Os06g0616400 protein n=2 Tax=Oryza sativa subsp. japonica TaxID=39947 RepID=Q69U89_ORYSJ|nr:hypothetical protein EE612_035350 [Oryza sativa]BAD35656.1 unknown protein [Oryza sativa Japonica Group]BAD35927.1 unknown protein [Oryza sativa Japonica Group]BAF19993.1 Os06g0616400 [Oryza sativa Japonica Group]BAS98628.1 Os06g0616400 [Oryza sativa Japonica Group]|eukprot:NP_001058079.1 Os06g0616400 [Oryza sativa Japonica Group]
MAAVEEQDPAGGGQPLHGSGGGDRPCMDPAAGRPPSPRGIRLPPLLFILSPDPAKGRGVGNGGTRQQRRRGGGGGVGSGGRRPTPARIRQRRPSPHGSGGWPSPHGSDAQLPSPLWDLTPLPSPPFPPQIRLRGGASAAVRPEPGGEHGGRREGRSSGGRHGGHRCRRQGRERCPRPMTTTTRRQQRRRRILGFSFVLKFFFPDFCFYVRMI